MRECRRLGALVALWIVSASTVWAGQTADAVIDSGDVAWMLAASALVVGMIVPDWRSIMAGSSGAKMLSARWCRPSRFCVWSA